MLHSIQCMNKNMIQEPEHDPRTLLRVSICKTLEHTFDWGRKKRSRFCFINPFHKLGFWLESLILATCYTFYTNQYLQSTFFYVRFELLKLWIANLKWGRRHCVGSGGVLIKWPFFSAHILRGGSKIDGFSYQHITWFRLLR